MSSNLHFSIIYFNEFIPQDNDRIYIVPLKMAAVDNDNKPNKITFYDPTTRYISAPNSILNDVKINSHSLYKLMVDLNEIKNNKDFNYSNLRVLPVQNRSRHKKLNIHRENVINDIIKSDIEYEIIKIKKREH